MNLKLSPNARPDKISPTIHRRWKLVRQIDEQIGFVQQMIEGKQPRASWTWRSNDGAYFLPIKYGRHSIELKKGMYSVECPDLDHVETALCTVRAMTLSGDLDTHLEKAATDIRKRFGTSKI